jgi:hypothetical protein
MQEARKALTGGNGENGEGSGVISARTPNMPCEKGDSHLQYAGFDIGGWIAQSVEQRTENPCVGGSIPSPATTSINHTPSTV